MATRCSLGRPFQLWVIAYAASTNFQTVPGNLKTMLIRKFSGWNNSVVNEKANGELAAALTKHCPSKVGVYMLWIFV
jgi:hypothetical protein